MAAKRLSVPTGSAIAAIAASGAWLTGGALTITSLRSGATRIGILPSLLWLAFSAAAAFALISRWRPRGDRFALLILSAVLIAPWVPIPVPAAFYVWTGPLRVWLWVVLLAGLATPALIRHAPLALTRAVRDPGRAPWLAAACAAAAYLAGAYQISPIIPTGDEPHYLVIAQSIAKDHDLQIENNHRRGDYHAYYSGDLKPDYLRRGVNGEIYSVHAPGLALVLAPVLALFGYAGVVAFLALVSACATALAWVVTWRLTADAAASWFGWAAVSLSAPFFFQSFVVYPDAPGAAVVIVGVHALIRPRELSTKQLVATGAALAFLPWLHTRYVVAAIVLGLMILGRMLMSPGDAAPPGGTSNPGAGTARRAVALLSIPLVSAVCWFWFFYAVYGSPDPRGPYGGATQSDVSNLARGAVGLLFDQQFGVLPAAPVLLCALAGLAVVFRRSPRLGVELLVLIAPYGFVVGTYQMWWGGNSSPGRFIIPVMLPLAIPAGVWFHTRRGHAGKLLGLAALAVSLLTTVTLAAVDRGLLLYNFRDGSSRLLTWLSPLVNITTGLPSVFQTTPAAAFLHGLVWLGAIAATAAAGVYAERRGARPVAIAIAMGFAAMTTAFAALSIVWWDHGLSPVSGTNAASVVTPSSGAVALLRQFDSDSGQIGLRYDPLHRMRARDVLGNLTLGEAAAGSAAHDGPEIALLHLPAGVYAVEGTGKSSEPATVTIDSANGPEWEWHVDDASDQWRREVRLPVPIRALLARSPGSRELRVRPISVVGSRHRLTTVEPQHIERYGPALVFLIGGHAFMEPAGAWVEGGSFADFVVSPDADVPVRLFVRNPPAAANTIALEGDGWRQELILAAGEERTVPLPFLPSSGAIGFRVSAARGARPIEFERGSTDTRYLGCWIETRP